MISIKSVAHNYSGTSKINFKDWQINDGEQWLLLGESGSGKTTLLHILTGILKMVFQKHIKIHLQLELTIYLKQGIQNQWVILL